MKRILFIFTLCLILLPCIALTQDFLSNDSDGQTIYIGGVPLNSNNRIIQEAFDKDMPKALRTNIIRRTLENRKEMTIYSHAPSKGPQSAPITSVEFLDLSCLQCYNTYKKWASLMAPYEEKNLVRRVYIHAPIDLYETTNTAAFYARIAEIKGLFWTYLDALVNGNINEKNVFSKTLLNQGMEQRDLRNIIRDNTRRIYKEIDADAVLSKNVAQGGATYFINGVKIDQNITMEQVPLLIAYELKLHDRKYGNE